MLISVIVPVYNASEYLSRCLDSLRLQTYKDLEFILIDDGSSDESLMILLEYTQRDSRFKVISQMNLGVSQARNIGLQHIGGEYVLFVDSDDWIDEKMIELMYEKAIETNSDLVLCSYVREYKTGSYIRELEQLDVNIYEEEEIKQLQRRLIGPIGNELAHPQLMDTLGTVWGKLYRTSCLLDSETRFVDLSEIGSAEDVLFNISVFSYLKRLTYLKEPFYHYWKENKQSITTRYNEALPNQFKNLFFYMNSYIERNKLGEEAKIALSNRQIMSILGLGLNECSIANKKSMVKKIKAIKDLLNDVEIQRGYQTFSLQLLPIHWRLFHFLNKYRFSTCSFFMLSSIEMIRTKCR